ncbi:hypothetical protein [Brumimicrobium oceani]|uniref:hypothetical protein n=1 Tax=Brumimicrobium oceani TaxID=2100725 RepID=UPI0011B25D9F|nr:hypothetical protein [Brumimicrobium oceani]
MTQSAALSLPNVMRGGAEFRKERRWHWFLHRDKGGVSQRCAEGRGKMTLRCAEEQRCAERRRKRITQSAALSLPNVMRGGAEFHKERRWHWFLHGDKGGVSQRCAERRGRKKKNYAKIRKGAKMRGEKKKKEEELRRKSKKISVEKALGIAFT